MANAGPLWLDGNKDAAIDYGKLDWNIGGTLTFDGLDPAEVYTVELVASCNAANVAPYTVNGTTINFDVQADGYVAGNWMTWSNVSPDGSGSLTVHCSEAAPHTYGTYINALRILESN